MKYIVINIYVLINSILRKIRESVLRFYSLLYSKFLKLIIKECFIGNNLFLNGKTKISICRNSKIYIGNNLLINSGKYSNLAGVFKRTTIAVSSGANLKIGDNCGFSGISIFVAKSVNIGNNVLIGVNCMIWDTDFHQIYERDRFNNNKARINNRDIIIGDNVWIGGNAIILKGSKIGDNSVISAGSVVSGKIPKNQVWGGNPAKFLYSLSE